MKAFVAVAALLMATGAEAAAVQSLADLEAAAVQAVRQAAPAGTRVVAKADALDPRLRLPACSGKLQTQVPDLGRAASRVAVQVSCTADQGWNVRVPVSVQMFRDVLLSSQALARGDILNAGEVQTREMDVTRLGYGYLVDPHAVYGRQLRLPVNAGTVLTPGMLAPREVVKRGQQVHLVVDAGSIQVRAEGVALQAGDRGDLVRVKSLSCQCVVQGEVSAPGIVAVQP
ncbi:MAG TPA: flagellar basal body P-ring formation chaperone FlgA [Rhodanobacteraceae bacterium]|nr:flagellar basal body P-ring formation chaperone FlgA [Rhodanobacteraceae bacterium]